MEPMLILFSLIAIASIAFGKSTVQDRSTGIFVLYKAGDSDKAIAYLFSNSPFVTGIAEGTAFRNCLIKRKTAL